MNGRSRIRISDVFFLVMFTLILFQNPLASYNNIFRYTDEIILLLCLAFLGVWVLRKRVVDSPTVGMILVMWMIVGLGLFCSLATDIELTVGMVFTDLVYFLKDFICFISAGIYFREYPVSETFRKLFLAEVRLIILVAFICLLLSQFVNLGMMGSVRYGMSSYQFVYTGPGMFSQYCIILLLILTFDLQNASLTWDRILFFALFLIVWCSTLRSRALVAIAVWVLLLMVGRKAERVTDSGKSLIFTNFTRSGYILLAGVIVLFLGASQLQYYFGGTEETGRSLLFSGGMQVMLDYFPLGSGLGTFGTEVAANNYSPLYYRYNLDSYWALKKGGSELTDCYWPAVGAEFGILGLVLFVILIWQFCRAFLRQATGKKYYEIAVITYIIYLLISSTAAGIFSSYVTAGCLVICMAMMNTGQEEMTADEYDSAV